MQSFSLRAMSFQLLMLLGVNSVLITQEVKAQSLSEGFLNTEVEVFAPSSFGTTSPNSWPYAFDTDGDIDGDSVNDILTGGSIGEVDQFNRTPYRYYLKVNSGADGRELLNFSVDIAIPDSIYPYRAYADFAGDVNGDGTDDIVMVTPKPEGEEGGVRFFSGADGSLIRSFNYAQIDFVAGLGDINGDGVPEILLGPSWNSPGRVIETATGQSLFEFSWTRVESNRGLHYEEVIPLGLVDADQTIDFLINGKDQSDIISGSDGSVIRNVGYRNNTPCNSGMAYSVGDMDSDGVIDYIYSYGYREGAGYYNSTSVISGASGELLFDFEGLADDDGLLLSDYCSPRIFGGGGDLTGNGRPNAFYVEYRYGGDAVIIFDETGQSVARYQLDGGNWRSIAHLQVIGGSTALNPTSKLVGSSGLLIATFDPLKIDSDGDLLNDDEELQYGLSPSDPRDAAMDSDGDGRNNYAEILTGHDPKDAEDFPTLLFRVSSPEEAKGVRLLVDDHLVVDVPYTSKVTEIQGLPKKLSGVSVRVLNQPTVPYAVSIGPLMRIPNLDYNDRQVFFGRDADYEQVTEVDVLSHRPSQLQRNTQLVAVETINPSIVSALIEVKTEDLSQAAGVWRHRYPSMGLGDDFFPVKENNEDLSPEGLVSVVPIIDSPMALKTAILLDVSSSMSFADLIRAKQAIKDLIVDANGKSKLDKNQLVGIYVFDDQVRQVTDFTNVIDAELLSNIDAIQVGGPSTNLYGAVSEVVGLWDRQLSYRGSEDGHLIVITDGKDTAGLTSLSSVADLVQSAGKQVFSVAVGSEADWDSLRQISPWVLRANDFSEVDQKMREASDDALQRLYNSLYFLYNVFYASPKRAGTHTLNIRHLETSFNATGFQNVSPSMEVYGSKNIRSDHGTFLKAKTHFTQEDLLYRWTVTRVITQENSTTVSFPVGTSSTILGGDLMVSTTSEFSPELSLKSLGRLDDAIVELSVESFVSVDGSLYPFQSKTVQVTIEDGVHRTLDNCPDKANPSQADANQNGLGDACDPLSDSDGDGVPDDSDAFPDDATESQDTDSDGIGDNRELQLGTDPTRPDSDGDGFTDKEELDAGSDPLDAASLPEVTASGLRTWMLLQAIQPQTAKPLP